MFGVSSCECFVCDTNHQLSIISTYRGTRRSRRTTSTHGTLLMTIRNRWWVWGNTLNSGYLAVMMLSERYHWAGNGRATARFSVVYIAHLRREVLPTGRWRIRVITSPGFSNLGMEINNLLRQGQGDQGVQVGQQVQAVHQVHLCQGDQGDQWGPGK